MSGAITNALIRCTRSDREAAGLFELVRDDLGLWVLDLVPARDAPLSEQIAGIHLQLQIKSTELHHLRDGSLDYTLHLTFDLSDTAPIILPASLSALAAECGFNIEIYVNTIKGD